MSTPDIDTILQRIAKLQALASNAGATVAEAELAATKLQELLDKYNLSMDQVKPINTQTQQDVEFDKFERQSVRIFEWELQLLDAVCFATSCKYVYTSTWITFIGLATDVAVCKPMFIQFCAIAQHLATGATKEYSDHYLDPRELRGDKSLRSYRLSYLLGFAYGIFSVLKQARKANDQVSAVNAIVLVKEGLIKSAIDTKFGKLDKSCSSTAQTNNKAFNRGFNDGVNAADRKKLA